MNNFLNLFFKGIFVGIANIIPGVSGGTIAVVLRIFDQMIDAINNFFKQPKKHIRFLLPLLFGAVVGIIGFSKLLEMCLSRESLPTNIFFVGLVIGSIPLIYSQAKKREIKPIYFLVGAISFMIVVGMSFLKDSSVVATEIKITTSWGIKVFLSGMVASAAMVIPGISGSFVMVLLGLYNNILTALSSIMSIGIDGINMMLDDGFVAGFKYIVMADEFILLFIAGIGMIIGVILVSKVIAILLEKAFSITYFAILGLIFGSIFAIFKDPLTYSSYDGNIPLYSIILAVIMGTIGTIIALKLSKKE